MSEDLDFDIESIEQKISKYFGSQAIQSAIQDAIKKNLSRITIDINRMREVDPFLTKMVLKDPLKIIPLMEKRLNEISQEFKGEKEQSNTIQSKKRRKITCKPSRNVRNSFSIS